MQSYETSARVEDQGEVRVGGVPFAPGTEVEVTITLKRRSGEEFAALWQRLCGELRSRPALRNISEDEINEEVDRYRGGR